MYVFLCVRMYTNVCVRARVNQMCVCVCVCIYTGGGRQSGNMNRSNALQAAASAVGQHESLLQL